VKHGTRERGSANYPERVDQSVFLSTKRRGHRPFNKRASMTNKTHNPADKVERWDITRLTPYARNSRTHSDEQISQLAASIKEWGWTTPVLVDEDGSIIAGHGRTLAAQRLKMTEVPVMVAKGWSEAKKRAYVIADNKLALNAGWNEEMLKLELHALDEDDFKLELTGFSGDELTEIMFGKLIEPEEPEEQSVSSAFEVSVSCDNEAEQERVYEMLTKQGLKCRVLTM
jgi:ParB-like chromosome segregation protein Spo0J